MSGKAGKSIACIFRLQNRMKCELMRWLMCLQCCKRRGRRRFNFVNEALTCSLLRRPFRDHLSFYKVIGSANQYVLSSGMRAELNGVCRKNSVKGIHSSTPLDSNQSFFGNQMPPSAFDRLSSASGWFESNTRCPEPKLSSFTHFLVNMDFVQNLDPSKLTLGLTVRVLSSARHSYKQITGSLLCYFAFCGASV
jgi:hypothetical protein